MECSVREKRILLFLLNSPCPLTTDQLAQEIGVSKRTIQREIDILEVYLQNWNCVIEKKKNVGLRIRGNEDHIQQLRSQLLCGHEIDGCDIHQRRVFILYELLRNRAPKKRITFAHQFHVSESTIGSDMDAIQEWMEKNNLKIIKKPGYGITFDGSEADYREALRRFINDFIEIDSNTKKDKVIKALIQDKKDGIYTLLNSRVIEKVERVLKGLNEPRLEALSEDAYISLVLHISISIIRIREGGIVENNQEVLANLDEYEDYDLALRILKAMELEFSLKIPRVELSYLLLHIEGSKIGYSRQSDLEIKSEEELLEMVGEMVDVFDPEKASNLKNDPIFIRGLIVHLQPVLVRLKNHMNIFNPLLEEIKNEYPDVYLKCKKASRVITKYTGYQVNEEEIGYLAMHFGSAVERIYSKHRYTRTVSIGVVCASGFGVARLMMTKLHNCLEGDVQLFPFGKEEIGEVCSDIDFFVTSFNLDAWNIDYIQVNPLIGEKDIEQIRHKIEDYSHIHKKKTDVQKKSNNDIQKLAKEINNIIDTFKQSKVSWTLSMEQVIEYLACKITQNDYQKDLVVQTILNREQMYTQVFEDLGIALFHGISQGVSNCSVQLCVTEQLKAFQDERLKGIHTVLMIVVPNGQDLKSQIDILGYLSSSLINHKKFLEVLKKGEEKEVQEALRNVLQEYFFEYVKNL